MKMLFSNQFSFFGDTAVGKTKTVAALAELLGLEVVSASKMMLEFAKKLKMTREEFARHNKNHPEQGWDKKCDTVLCKRAEENGLILDGRLASMFAPKSYRIRVVCHDYSTRAKRRQKDQDYAHETVEELERKIRERDHIDFERYPLLYSDYRRSIREDFDLEVDTLIDRTPEIIEQILKGHDRWLQQNEERILWVKNSQ